ncbi:hypothetical protein, partial [Cohnella sp.]|uniref:hypothetical protein n=1 Tax=Cohnella sp. TaxID=1883426 RepID=UPI0035695BCD
EDCPPTRKEGIRVISPSDFNDPLSKNEEKPLRLKRRGFLDDLVVQLFLHHHFFGSIAAFFRNLRETLMAETLVAS